jgi:hypothetical protein
MMGGRIIEIKPETLYRKGEPAWTKEVFRLWLMCYNSGESLAPPDAEEICIRVEPFDLVGPQLGSLVWCVGKELMYIDAPWWWEPHNYSGRTHTVRRIGSAFLPRTEDSRTLGKTVHI